jgi:hypothetical protein
VDNHKIIPFLIVYTVHNSIKYFIISIVNNIYGSVRREYFIVSTQTGAAYYLIPIENICISVLKIYVFEFVDWLTRNL